jgi:type IV secretory pathway VirB6-like protein
VNTYWPQDGAKKIALEKANTTTKTTKEWSQGVNYTSFVLEFIFVYVSISFLTVFKRIEIHNNRCTYLAIDNNSECSRRLRVFAEEQAIFFPGENVMNNLCNASRIIYKARKRISGF